MSKNHDAQALDREQATALYEHIRAIEALEADKKDIQEDITQRKTLVTESLPVQKDVLDFVLKRRKHSKGIVNNFDTMLQLVEEAVAEVEAEHADETRATIAAAARRGAPAEDEELDFDPEDDEEEAEEDAGDEQPPFEPDDFIAGELTYN